MARFQGGNGGITEDTDAGAGRAARGTGKGGRGGAGQRRRRPTAVGQGLDQRALDEADLFEGAVPAEGQAAAGRRAGDRTEGGAVARWVDPGRRGPGAVTPL